MPDRDETELTERAFVRELPGGGFAAIDISIDRSPSRPAVYRGVLRIERRTQPRAPGHEPPVIETATGPSARSVLHQLLPAAQSNVEIGAALCALERRRAASPETVTVDVSAPDVSYSSDGASGASSPRANARSAIRFIRGS
jgi:hypothetical protein